MDYCTLEDIRDHVTEARLVEITDDTHPNPSGAVQAGVVAKAITESGNIIDAYIGKRFRLPLPGVPSVLRTICVDLSIYNLYERVTELDVPDGMQLRYKNAINLLKGIADGTISIGDIPEEGVAETGFKAVSNSGQAMFTLDSMRSL